MGTAYLTELYNLLKEFKEENRLEYVSNTTKKQQQDR